MTTFTSFKQGMKNSIQTSREKIIYWEMPKIKKWLVFHSSHPSISSFYSAKGVNTLYLFWRLQPTVKEYGSVINTSNNNKSSYDNTKRLLHERKIFDGMPSGKVFLWYCFPNKKLVPQKNKCWKTIMLKEEIKDELRSRLILMFRFLDF